MEFGEQLKDLPIDTLNRTELAQLYCFAINTKNNVLKNELELHFESKDELEIDLNLNYRGVSYKILYNELYDNYKNLQQKYYDLEDSYNNLRLRV